MRLDRFFEPSFWLETTPEEVKKELNSGMMDVHARDSFDNTPLMYASSCSNYTEIIQMLIDAGATINTENKKGITPLIIACCENKNPDIVITLLDNGADVNHGRYMRTPYYCLTENKHLRNTRAHFRLMKECTKQSSFGKCIRAFIN